MRGNFASFSFHLLTFFKITFFKKFFQEHYQSVKPFGARSGPKFCRFVGPDLSPNCLQRLSADNNKERVNFQMSQLELVGML